MGTTFIADLIDCRQMLHDEDSARELALRVVERAGMTPIGEACATVSDGFNSGATAVIVVVPLKESHLAVHTWPELSYAMLDFTTCGDRDKAETAFRDLCSWFLPEEVLIHEWERLAGGEC